MKKVLALILSIALVLSVVVLPTATFAIAETAGTDSSLAFSDAFTVLEEDINPRAIRTKVLSDGTVAAVYYRSGNGIFYATSKDGGVTFSDGVKLIGNATDSELAKSEEVTTQTTLAKKYVSEYGEYGRGRLEAQNPNLIELKNGDVAAFYRYNTFETDPTSKPWSIYYASICYQILDKETGVWGDVQVMYECTEENVVADSGSSYGVWEPDPVYIDDELFCYFADTDLPGNVAYQHIMYCVYDEEAEAFGTPEIAQNGIEHSSRDGMSVVTKLNDGSYAMVFESTRTDKDDYTDINNYTTFVIKMSFSKDGRVWTDPVIVAKPNPLTTPATASPEYAVCAAPYVVTLPDGRLAVSYQTTDRYTGRVPNRVSYRIGTQVAVSSVAINYDTFAANSIDDDVTSYFATELNPGVLGENEFSKSAELMVNNDKLFVYYSVGSNNWVEENGVETERHDFGAVRMAYMDVSIKETTDYGSLDNYIVYQKSTTGAAPTASNGKITIAAGDTTNLIAGKGGKEIVESNLTIDNLYSADNWTVQSRSGYKVTFNSDNIATLGGGKAILKNTENMTRFHASTIIQGNVNSASTNYGYIMGGFIFHAQESSVTGSVAFNPEGYYVGIRRNTTSLNKIELVVRYCDAAGAVTYSKGVTLSSTFDKTDYDPKFKLDLTVDDTNMVAKVYNVETGAQLGATTTIPLDNTAADSDASYYEKGSLGITVNGVHTFSEFTLDSAVTETEVDSSIMEKANNLNAHAVFTMLETPATMYAGFDFRVQKAAAVTRGINGYAIKLLQSADANGVGKMKLEFSVYGAKDGTDFTNLKSYAVDIASVLSDSTTSANAKLIMDATVIGNDLTVVVTNFNDTSKTVTENFDLDNYVQYADYGKGGYGIYKHGTGTITVEDVEFTVLPLDVENIDNTLYTVYAPEESAGVKYEDGKFVSDEAVAKKMILNDTEVSDFSANATLEIGYDGQLKAGIIFRAQNVGNDADAMEGYSAVLWKNENGTGNFGRVILLVYKWGVNAAGETVYLGEVGRLDDRKTLNAVYPDAETDMLAAVGAHLTINIKVDGDVIRANFDVLDEYNEVAASSDTKSLLLTKDFAAENVNTYYEKGAIGLSLSTAGAVCDLNITETVDGKDVSVMSDYTVYSNDNNTMTIDSSVNKKMYSITKGRKQAVLKGVPLTNFEASAVLKSNTAGEVYNMGFDFMINEATHSGYAYNTTHATMGYEGYRAVLVRNSNTGNNPAGAVLYLFKFTKDESGYTRSTVKQVNNGDFFADYTTADTTDKEYAEVEVELNVKLVDGNLTAVATMCEYPERTITLTAEGLEGSGSVGWFISDHGSVSQISVNSVVTDGDLNADGNVNGTDLAIMRKAVMGVEKVGLAIGDISVKDREIDVRDIVKLKKLAANIA